MGDRTNSLPSTDERAVVVAALAGDLHDEGMASARRVIDEHGLHAFGSAVLARPGSRTRRRVVLVLAVALAAAIAIDLRGNRSTASPRDGSDAPAVTIATPAAGQAVSEPPYVVASATTTPHPESDTWHRRGMRLFFRLDYGELDKTRTGRNGDGYLPPGRYTAASDFNFTVYTNVPPGQHTINAFLVDRDLRLLATAPPVAFEVGPSGSELQDSGSNR